MAQTITLPDVADTEAFGIRLAATLSAGDVVILDGPLGAGKTALTRGIAAGLGVQGRVSSPTFIIARVHRAGAPDRPGLVHVDAYRLTDSAVPLDEELDALDLDTDLADSVVVVEWGEGVAERLVSRYLMVRLRRQPDSDVREVSWEWCEAAR
ncbi:tRNA (adenosine(37)-N6)-threonylcarbamoyltransferase complex ATPase subunit type 1 TsaE [Gordonia sp. CPCC 205333]|uniref:tRNA (adenosine(37)-N6)-threonylcarbamoyltransferase complex ATPase subunit type 1 TsaE n=1 Tax=Gordonia sp. CPCC 205333 TaxID=3140790 RepID=UPI003AF3BD6B